MKCEWSVNKRLVINAYRPKTTNKEINLPLELPNNQIWVTFCLDGRWNLTSHWFSPLSMCEAFLHNHKSKESTQASDARRWKKVGVPAVKDGQNLPPLVGIESTHLSKIGGAPSPPLPTPQFRHHWRLHTFCQVHYVRTFLYWVHWFSWYRINNWSFLHNHKGKESTKLGYVPFVKFITYVHLCTDFTDCTGDRINNWSWIKSKWFGLSPKMEATQMEFFNFL